MYAARRKVRDLIESDKASRNWVTLKQLLYNQHSGSYAGKASRLIKIKTRRNCLAVAKLGFRSLDIIATFALLSMEIEPFCSIPFQFRSNLTT
jgi:hypothetical protein